MNMYLSSVKNFYARTYQYAVAHKAISVVVLVVVTWGVYRVFFGGVALAQTRYVLGTVGRGTLVMSVSGVGQISASGQIDVKPKTSADVVSVDVAAGQQVKAGQVLARLDTRDAAQSVQNASIALQNARITLQKLQQNQTIDSTAAQEDLDQAYLAVFNGVTNVFLQLPDIIETTRGVLYDNTLKGGCSPNMCEYGNRVSENIKWEFKAMTARTESDYKDARAAYDPAFDEYRSLRRDATPEQVGHILEATRNTVDLMAQVIKSEQNMFDTLVSDMNAQAALHGGNAQIPQQITTYQTQLASAIGTVNSFATQLSGQARSITNAKQALANAKLSDPLDLASQQNTVVQREADLRNAQRTLAEHIIRAPFDGVVAKVNVQKGDSASSGTTIATVITKKQLVVLPLNEVDVANITLGQKTTLTFDAIPSLTMTGKVEQVDSIGTTTQGVVNYNVTIALDTQNDNVRPGMSVAAKIITDVRQDVLTVPLAAVKRQNGNAYVEILDGVALTQAASITGIVSPVVPQQISVTIGASGDTSVEILSGLTENETIVVRSISTSTTTSTTTTQGRSGSMLPGVGGGSFRGN